MKVIQRAKNIGFCFGVERAIEIARKAGGGAAATVYTYGELIHNAYRHRCSLQRRGAVIPAETA